ncbi:ACT domain-containing protein [Actinospica sp.]|uniref:ACT domain-containing protein n=1 Tax=Actinospica sp. TaxID=1872142 RepID=UPI002C35D752|nr:ACT domain-containing protein [Actinospica sp.]HWG27446.1 ACT domain-containing protein [Actinospica sp.]
MAGETELSALLGGMRPELHPGEYVFTSTPDAAIPAGVAPIATVAEDEGLTLVLRKQDADRLGLGYDHVAGWITLRVHSALEAVGLTAAVSAVLADAGLSCNVVAAFYHDHLFVPHESAARAVTLLEDLAQRPRGQLGTDRAPGGSGARS